MVKHYIFLVILVGSSVPSGSYKCDLKTDSGDIKSVCCADYEAKGNECIACSTGYTSDIGQRCRPCPGNTYGERCRRECSCVGYEICDNVKGCVDFQSTTSTSLDKTADITSFPRDTDAITNGENTDSSVQGLLSREIVVYFTLSVLVLVFGICACFIFHKKKKTNIIQSQNMSHPLSSHNIGMDQRVYDLIDETNMLDDQQVQQMQTWHMSSAYLDVISDSNISVCVESKDLDNQDSACQSLSNTQTKSQENNLMSGDSTSSSEEYPQETPQDYLNPYQPMIEMSPPKIIEYLRLATVHNRTERNFVDYKKGALNKPQYPLEVEKDILPLSSDSS